ncbi:MAG: hypothetical protein QF704_05835 [Anaerolineales bacterium]|nr:hypothetical protein [Anaerolineales bacterium]
MRVLSGKWYLVIVYVATCLYIYACGTTESELLSDTKPQSFPSPQNTMTVNAITESLNHDARSVVQTNPISQLQDNDAISSDEGLMIERDANQEVNSSDNLNNNVSYDTIFGVYPCVDSDVIKFVAPLYKPELITAIVPMGKVSAGSGHVTPTDHLYIHRNPPIEKDEEYVLAPAAGTLVKISRFPEDQPLIAGDMNSRKVPDYRVVIMHSCSLFTIFIHLGEFSAVIADQIGVIPLGKSWFSGGSEPILLDAGQEIAKFGGDSMDWSVHDGNITLAGFVEPKHYEAEPWKIHTVDPFQFYEEPYKSQLITKVVRSVEPRSGKIDYDKEGTIVGNWFLEGTIDYSGNVPEGSQDYWKGHLSIAYGYIDPTQIRISIGYNTGVNIDLCNICFGAYGVRGNSPDPASVIADSGIVKYELMSRREQSRWNREQVGDKSLGTFLVQHLGDRSIRVEVLPDLSPNDVDGFSEDARIYKR